MGQLRLAFLIPAILILCLAVNNTLPFPLPTYAPILPLPLPPPPPPPPLHHSAPLPRPRPRPPKPRFVRCRSPFYRFCKNVWLRCPPSCPSSCLADCASCKPVCSCNFPGAVCQDPRFVGGDGITFYFHGHKEKDYCLVSDTNLHINGHFIGKTYPNSPRDFTWVQSIGIMFDDRKLLIGAKRTSAWNDNVDRLSLSIDGRPIIIPTTEGSQWKNDDDDDVADHQKKVYITRTGKTNGVIVEVLDKFRVTVAVVPITKEESRTHRYGIDPDVDCFAHLELGFRFFNLTDGVDGVLGQTYRRNYVSKTKVNAAMPVMGGEKKYLSSGIFAADCAVSRFPGGGKTAAAIRGINGLIWK